MASGEANGVEVSHPLPYAVLKIVVKLAKHTMREIGVHRLIRAYSTRDQKTSLRARFA